MEIGIATDELLRAIQDPRALVAMLSEAPLASRWIAGALGAVIMVAGGKLYRVAVVTPGFVLGTMIGKALSIPGDPLVATVAIVVAGLGGALLFHFLERVAVAVLGAMVGANLAGFAWPIFAGPAPWWGILGASLLMSVFFPKIFRMLLLPITALLGATILAACFGQGSEILVIAGLALIGAIFQSTVL